MQAVGLLLAIVLQHEEIGTLTFRGPSNQGPNAVREPQGVVGEVLGKYCRMLLVEGLYALGRQGGRHTGACSNAATPRLVRIGPSMS